MAYQQGKEQGDSNKPISYKGLRVRSRKACETCHSRKIRCDAGSKGAPCTNCAAFGFECILHIPKKKRPRAKRAKHDLSISNKTPKGIPSDKIEDPYVLQQDEGDSEHTNASAAPKGQDEHPSIQTENGHHPQQAPLPNIMDDMTEPLAYCGELGGLWRIMQRVGVTSRPDHPLIRGKAESRPSADVVGSYEMDLLRQHGAFLLPDQPLRDELVAAFFKWAFPILPVLNKRQFLRQYRDLAQAPSLLLLQAILLAGSSMTESPRVFDANGSRTPTTMMFYRRAKALYDAQYEKDRVAVVQALIIMGWYTDSPTDVDTISRWSRLAIVEAQSIGIHRSLESPLLTKSQRGLYKRIWWALVSRDRLLAVSLGRPMAINLEDSDNPPLCEDDFDEGVGSGPSSKDKLAAGTFFMHYVKLNLIMGLIYARFYSAITSVRPLISEDARYQDALADWKANLPATLVFSNKQHDFWSALLQIHYDTALCLLHGSGTQSSHSFASLNALANKHRASVSQASVSDAAKSIGSTIESVRKNGQLLHLTPFVVYSLLSALVVDYNQIRTSSAVLVGTSRRTCLLALKELSNVWLTAENVYSIFKHLLSSEIRAYTSIVPSRSTMATPTDEEFQHYIDQDSEMDSSSNDLDRSDSPELVDTPMLGAANLEVPRDAITSPPAPSEVPIHGHRDSDFFASLATIPQQDILDLYNFHSDMYEATISQGFDAQDQGAEDLLHNELGMDENESLPPSSATRVQIQKHELWPQHGGRRLSGHHRQPSDGMASCFYFPAPDGSRNDDSTDWRRSLV